MAKKDPTNNGGRVLLKKYGPKYFSKLADKKHKKAEALKKK